MARGMATGDGEETTKAKRGGSGEGREGPAIYISLNVKNDSSVSIAFFPNVIIAAPYS